MEWKRGPRNKSISLISYKSEKKFQLKGEKVESSQIDATIIKLHMQGIEMKHKVPAYTSKLCKNYDIVKKEI